MRETSQFLYLVFWKKRKEDMRHYEGATQCVLAAAIPYFFCLAGTETKEDLVYTGRWLLDVFVHDLASSEGSRQE